MWCLCACPRKSTAPISLSETTGGSGKTVEYISNVASGSSAGPSNRFEARRRSSGGYVQLRHEQPQRISEESELEIAEFIDNNLNDLNPQNHSKPSFICFPNLRKKRKMLFNFPTRQLDKQIESTTGISVNRQTDLEVISPEFELSNTNNVVLDLQMAPGQSSNSTMSQDSQVEQIENKSTKCSSVNDFWDINSNLIHARFPRRHSMSACSNNLQGPSDTPLNIVLTKLSHVREGLVALTGEQNLQLQTNPNKKPKQKEKKTSPICCYNDIAWKELAKETLDEFEWCLLQLSGYTSSKHMDSTNLEKFKLLIDREFSKLANSSKSKPEVVKNIRKFLESDCDQSIINPPDLIGSSQIKLLTGKSSKSLLIDHGAIATSNQPGGSHKFQPSKYLFSLDHEIYKHLGVPTRQFEMIDEMLDKHLDSWGLPIFEFDELTNGHPLVVMVLKIFTKRKLMSVFSIDPSTVFYFFLNVENNYDRGVPYHNCVHAADVTQSIHVLLSSDPIDDVFTELEIFAVIFACAIHDVQHPGVTNQFLINIGHDLAIMYNDISVLENHHLAVAFRLMQKEGCDVFSGLSCKQRTSMRKIIVDLVLATDMSRHMTLLADLQQIVDACSQQTKAAAAADLLGRQDRPRGHADRINLLQNMVHCADLSNPTKPLSLYQQWTQRIMEEFFRQGDREKQAGLEVSPMCDRNTSSIEKSQVSFIDFIVQPLWSAWAQLVYPFVQPMLDTLSSNREWYQMQLAIATTLQSELPGPLPIVYDSKMVSCTNINPNNPNSSHDNNNKSNYKNSSNLSASSLPSLPSALISSTQSCASSSSPSKIKQTKIKKHKIIKTAHSSIEEGNENEE